MYTHLNLEQTGIPKFRTHVLYVPQRPSMLPGTPRNFMQRICTFAALKSRVQAESGSNISNEARAIDVAEQWGIDEELWDRPWSNLSGGESQRIALAAALGLNSADVLLLDGWCFVHCRLRHGWLTLMFCVQNRHRRWTPKLLLKSKTISPRC